MDDQTFKTNLIENLTSEHQEEFEYESECGFNLESNDFNLEQIVDSTIEWASNPIPLNPEPKDLIQPSTEQFSSSELKALPSHLKFVYLGGNEALPVIMISHLIEDEKRIFLLC